jgi:hypothetical protein
MAVFIMSGGHLRKAQTRMAVKVLRQDAVGSKKPSSSFMSEEEANRELFWDFVAFV